MSAARQSSRLTLTGHAGRQALTAVAVLGVAKAKADAKEEVSVGAFSNALRPRWRSTVASRLGRALIVLRRGRRRGSVAPSAAAPVQRETEQPGLGAAWTWRRRVNAAWTRDSGLGTRDLAPPESNAAAVAAKLQRMDEASDTPPLPSSSSPSPPG